VKLIGLMPVRNEAWVLGLSARVALMWCDELVILDHQSDDTSPEIIIGLHNEFQGRVSGLLEMGPWDEMRHRQAMLELARKRGATHIAIIDADEVLTGPIATEGIAKAMVYHAKESLLQLPLYNLRGGIELYHANGLWGSRIVSVAFADDPPQLWSGDRFHAREPQGKFLRPFQPIKQGEGGVMHLWGANERRLLAKHALYKVTERLRWPDKPVRDIDFEYSQCVTGGTGIPPECWTYNAVPESWWAPYQHLMKYLDIDAEPWQDAEVRRLVDLYGRERFAGLDLFGVEK
jgi:Glycosyl transferase family 2